MKKCLVVLTIFLLFVFLAACMMKNTPPVVARFTPGAKPLLTTLRLWLLQLNRLVNWPLPMHATPQKYPDANESEKLNHKQHN